MPNINHKRKTSKKSKSSKRSKNAIRNKKTRSNIRKMRGGAIIGDYVYNLPDRFLMGQIIGKSIFGTSYIVESVDNREKEPFKISKNEENKKWYALKDIDKSREFIEQFGEYSRYHGSNKSEA
jgi:hypothetical protein